LENDVRALTKALKESQQNLDRVKASPALAKSAAPAEATPPKIYEPEKAGYRNVLEYGVGCHAAGPRHESFPARGRGVGVTTIDSIVELRFTWVRTAALPPPRAALQVVVESASEKCHTNFHPVPIAPSPCAPPWPEPILPNLSTTGPVPVSLRLHHAGRAL